MVSFKSKKTVQSKKVPGVDFTIRILTEGSRLELRSKILEASVKLNELYGEMQHLIDRKAAMEQKQYGEEFAKIQIAIEECQMNEIDPEWFIWGCVNINNLSIDDKPARPEDWKDLPSELYGEILAAIRGDSELGAEERKNSESRTISGEQAGKNETSTTAEPASLTDGIAAEIVPSTSPN